MMGLQDQDEIDEVMEVENFFNRNFIYDTEKLASLSEDEWEKFKEVLPANTIE